MRKHGSLDPDSDYHPSDRAGEGLEVEYQQLIANLFRRWGIAVGSVTVEVRLLGRAPDGYDVFVGMVRITKWDRTSALRMLIGLPMLEAKMRKLVRGTWLADYSHFGGLWLHASENLHTAPGAAELRNLLLSLVPPSPPAPGETQDPAGGYSASTLPGAEASRQPAVQPCPAAAPGGVPASGTPVAG